MESNTELQCEMQGDNVVFTTNKVDTMALDEAQSQLRGITTGVASIHKQIEGMRNNISNAEKEIERLEALKSKIEAAGVTLPDETDEGAGSSTEETA